MLASPRGGVIGLRTEDTREGRIKGTEKRECSISSDKGGNKKEESSVVGEKRVTSAMREGKKRGPEEERARSHTKQLKEEGLSLRPEGPKRCYLPACLREGKKALPRQKASPNRILEKEKGKKKCSLLEKCHSFGRKTPRGPGETFPPVSRGEKIQKGKGSAFEIEKGLSLEIGGIKKGGGGFDREPQFPINGEEVREKKGDSLKQRVGGMGAA